MKSRFHIILWLLVLIFVSITLIVFSDTLALFETTSSGVVNSDIGKWIIRISNETITDIPEEGEEQQTIVVNNFVYSTNSHVESGYIAPGGSAYFDLIIDATDCEVAVKYTLDLDLSSVGYASNIRFQIDGLQANGIVRTGETEYSGIISLASINNDETVSIRIYVYWDDDPLYNEDDTAIGIVEDNSLAIPFGFSAVQYLGETLTPYSG